MERERAEGHSGQRDVLSGKGARGRREEVLVGAGEEFAPDGRHRGGGPWDGAEPGGLMKQCRGRRAAIWGAQDTAPSPPPFLPCAGGEQRGRGGLGTEGPGARGSTAPENLTWTCLPLQQQDAAEWPWPRRRPGMAHGGGGAGCT